jgi:PII-like signaling protein
MTGTFLKFYVQEHRRHHGILLYEWLLERARKMGIHGGTALRTIAGFGRHGVMHEQHFFELAGDVPIEVEFVVSDAEAESLLNLVKQEKIQVFYMRMPVEYGLLDGK